MVQKSKKKGLRVIMQKRYAKNSVLCLSNSRSEFYLDVGGNGAKIMSAQSMGGGFFGQFQIT